MWKMRLRCSAEKEGCCNKNRIAAALKIFILLFFEHFICNFFFSQAFIYVFPEKGIKY